MEVNDTVDVAHKLRLENPQLFGDWISPSLSSGEKLRGRI
jgi:hypothetical protein